MKGLVVTDSKNVKILKYHNETKILHGPADLIDEKYPAWKNQVNLVFCIEKFRNNCTFSLH
jgi:hypothetical protein